MYNLDLFNWRKTNPGLALTSAAADYLDVVTSLLEDDVRFYHQAVQRCDVFDVLGMLDYVKAIGFVSDGDTAWSEARTAVLAARTQPYMTAVEVEARMKTADGACPFCGFHVSFSSEADSRGYFHCISRCSHFRFDNVQGIDECLRRPKTWAGKRWPYSWDRKIAKDDGSPLVQEISHHCSACRTDDAHRVFGARVQQFLTEAVEKAQTPGWFKPGWSHACSYLAEREPSLGRTARDIVTDSDHEFRLNGAGLKLYTRGIKIGFMRGEINFNMRVGGDQASMYPEFVEWANARLAELKLTEDALAAA